jgi:hypothetical protein
MIQNFKLCLMTATIFLLASLSTFAQNTSKKNLPSSQAVLITTEGRDRTLSCYIEQQYKLDEFEIQLLHDSLFLDSITVTFDPRNIIMGQISVTILEGDSLENIFAAWVCDGSSFPLYLTSTGFSSYVQRDKIKRFAIYIKASMYHEVEISPTIYLSGSNHGSSKTIELYCHKVAYRQF